MPLHDMKALMELANMPVFAPPPAPPPAGPLGEAKGTQNKQTTAVCPICDCSTPARP